jgi:dodecin
VGYRARSSIHPSTNRETIMSVAKVIEITASSKKSFEDAISHGIERASETISDIQGAWVQDQKVVVSKGKVTEYRVSMKLTFVLGGKKK